MCRCAGSSLSNNTQIEYDNSLDDSYTFGANKENSGFQEGHCPITSITIIATVLLLDIPLWPSALLILTFYCIMGPELRLALHPTHTGTCALSS